MDLPKKRLGRTNLDVTAMGLGTYQITGEFGVHYGEARKILDFALDSGINFIDTAQMYGFGESEELVGQALRRHPGKTVYISDKLGYADRSVSRNLEEAAYQDPVALKRMVKHSLWLLQRDYVEIFMIHEPARDNWWKIDLDTGDSVALCVLEELKKEGVVKNIGLGCWISPVLARLCATGRFDVVLNAGGITLFHRQMFDVGLLDVCAEHDVGVIVGGVLQQGFAGELIAIQPQVSEAYKNDANPDVRLRGAKLEKLYDLCERSGIPILELSLRYVLSFDGIHCHIPGARLEEHVRQNLEMSKKGALPPDVVAEIVKISMLTL